MMQQEVRLANYSLRDPATAAFVVIPVLLAATFVCGIAVAWRRAGATSSNTLRVTLTSATATAAWMAVTWWLAASGELRNWDRTPPPFAVLIVAILVLAFAVAFSRLGIRLAHFIPLWILVATQAFRLPLELAMHAMANRGVMPEQMTYTGRNFDIVTGATAIIVAALVASGHGGRRLVAAWNFLGLVLLTNVVVVAILSTPPIRYFGAERMNVWVTYAPFVWLPAILVTAAFTGHLVILRAMDSTPRRS